MAGEKTLAEILESTGLPVTFALWGKSPPDLPYIVYLVDDSESFSADNVTYHYEDNYNIELYSERKDPIREALVEAALTENDIYFEKEEDWIVSEEMYRVVYSV